MANSRKNNKNVEIIEEKEKIDQKQQEEIHENIAINKINTPVRETF